MRWPIRTGILTALLSGFVSLFVHGQTTGWVWASAAAHQGATKALDIARDPAGNVYVAGYFTDSISIGGFKLDGFGGKDILIVKYSRTGSVIWAKAMGGSGNDLAGGIAAHGAGFGFTGYFTGAATIGGEAVTSHGQEDIFIASFDTTGNKRWVRTTGTALPDEGQKLSFDAAGRIIATGYFGKHAGPPHVYEQLAFGTDTLTSQGDADVYIVKYDGSGNVLWAANGGSVASDLSAGVAGDLSGNTYVTGTFDANLAAYFDQVQINNISGGFLTNNIFLVKYDSAGTALWGRVIGALGTISSGASEIRAAGVTCYGNQVYVTGGYGNCDLRFHNSTTLTGLGAFDIFIARFGGTGNLEWARKAGSTGHDLAYDLCSDEAGHILITGTHYGAAFGALSLPVSGTQDVFVAAYDSLGTAQWAMSGAQAGTAFANGIVCDPSGMDVRVAGDFPTAITNFGSDTLTNSSSFNMFVASLSSPVYVGTPLGDAHASVYPNPASEVVMVEADGQSPYDCFVYDATGRLVCFREVDGLHPIAISCGAWPGGMYLVLLRSGRETISRKLIIQR